MFFHSFCCKSFLFYFINKCKRKKRILFWQFILYILKWRIRGTRKQKFRFSYLNSMKINKYIRIIDMFRKLLLFRFIFFSLVFLDVFFLFHIFHFYISVYISFHFFFLVGYQCYCKLSLQAVLPVLFFFCCFIYSGVVVSVLYMHLQSFTSI